MEHWISAYGYPAIFLMLVLGILGLPIPDETILAFCGYLIFKGTLHGVPAYLSALAGSWCGISLSYTIGRTLGTTAVSRYGKRLHLTEDRLARVHQWFDRVGHWALAIGYFIAGVRHLTAIVAGMSGLEFSSFALYAWSGGAIWALTFILLGYFLGDQWKTIEEIVHRDLGYASLALIAVVAVALGVREFKRRQSKPVSLPRPGPRASQD
ncbi:MAG TPA: DedA family protein [Bryobacteraceae bacterium]|jgi:membrane protein DedA with SNARE-associated domain